ncbi:MAG: endonuclease/exonuclease/phosphatase family protein [Minisyncoccia bacterium]
MRLKILQWNIWGREKVENILKLVKRVNSDILCFQELMIGSAYNNKQDVAKIISEKTNFEYNFALAHESDDGRILGNGIFSRFRIVKNSNFFIADSKNSNDYSSQGRSCAVSKILINSEKDITIATAHSSYNYKFVENKAKLKEIKKLVNFFKKNTGKLVFTGDLNITPNTESIRQIEKHLVHCGPDYKKPTWTTKPFSYNGFEEDKLKWRLDYAFATKDIKIINSKIIKTEYSDHLPILIKVEV